jgi:subtilisin family serine protease
MSTIISKDTQKKADRSYTSRRAANWNKASLKCGQGIRLGMIDGSVDTKHPTFKGSNLKYRSFHLKGQTAGAIRHGTAVANVFHKRKKGKSRASTKSVLLAINWLTKLRVDVINFSIGGCYNSLIAHAIEKAHKSGIILIASAGNSEPFTKKKSYPAAYKQAVAIAASDRFNRTAKFSSAGSYVEFTAPGVRIWTAVPGGGRAMSGTSFSAPIVSSLVAAALKTEGIQDLESVRGYLRSHAKDRGKEGWDKYTGWGIVGIKPLC